MGKGINEVYIDTDMDTAEHFVTWPNYRHWKLVKVGGRVVLRHWDAEEAAFISEQTFPKGVDDLTEAFDELKRHEDVERLWQRTNELGQDELWLEKVE